MTSKISRIITVTGLSVLLTLSALAPSFAGAEGRRNTAAVLTVLAAVALSNIDNSRDRDYRYNDRYRSDNRRDNDYGYRVEVRRDKDYRYESNNSHDRGRYVSSQKKYGRSQPRGNAYGHYKRGDD